MDIDQIKSSERKKVYKGINSLFYFLKENNIPLFGYSSLEYQLYGKLNYNKPIIVTTNKNNKVFLDFFKALYKKTRLFFSLPVKNKYNYIYLLNLQPVLIIHFTKKEYPIQQKNGVSYVESFHSLQHLYYENTMSLTHSQYWTKWVDIELETNKYLLNLNLPLTCPTKVAYNYETLFKYKPIITGGQAFDKIMNTTYFNKSKYQFIVTNKDMLEEFDEENITIMNTIDNINYFYTHYQIKNKDDIILDIFLYSKITNYVEIDGKYYSNYHGALFHLLYDNIDYRCYVTRLLQYIDTNNIDITTNDFFKVYQKNYVLEYSKNILQNRVKSYYKREEKRKKPDTQIVI